MHVREALEEAVRSTELPLTDVGRRAGISRAGLYRILRGEVEPRIDDARELALACGYDLDVHLRQVSDPLASVACRLLLGDERLSERAAEVAPWTRRLLRYAGEERPALVSTAGIASNPRQRAGAIGLVAQARNWDVDRLISAGIASQKDWVLSGWAALDAMGYDLTVPTLLWTVDVQLVRQLLADGFRRAPAATAQVLLLPADPSVFVGTVDLDGALLVDPLQGLLDAAGLGPEALELSERLAGALI